MTSYFKAAPDLTIEHYTDLMLVPDDVAALQINCGEQALQVVRTAANEWWAADTPGLITPINRILHSESTSFPNALGLRVDVASVGSYALFSAAGYNWRSVWRSQYPVEQLSTVEPDALFIGNIALVKNL